eukprot:TRINITY_DN32486_c0_g1_i1.p1 TRINITY_DN32486_c0_g1~~TRINITY_DN32486_c0_g1_i1.p1  ORF type:complete len:440 (-),score=86.19 TRINITY_DN32486_c0_g1_i1:44-1363(-)
MEGLDPARFSELVNLADEGQPQQLCSLLSRCDVQKLSINGSGALHAAASLGSAKGLQLIIEALRQQAEGGPAASLPGVNSLDTMGFTPLHAATEMGFAECVEVLLQARADTETLSADASFQMGQTTTLYSEGGRTALHIAAEKPDPALAEVLLAAGARLDARDSFGQLPQDLVLDRLLLSPGSATAALQRERLAGLLGAGPEKLSANQARDREGARASQRTRQEGLRDRITKAADLKRERDRRECARSVSERYHPLDADVACGKAVCPADILYIEGAGYGQADPEALGIRQPATGVFVFPLLSASLCAKIWAETEHYASNAAVYDLPLPVRHDGCLDLSFIFPELLQRVAQAAIPAMRALLPKELHGVTLQHAFRTKNFAGREVCTSGPIPEDLVFSSSIPSQPWRPLTGTSTRSAWQSCTPRRSGTKQSLCSMVSVAP